MDKNSLSLPVRGELRLLVFNVYTLYNMCEIKFPRFSLCQISHLTKYSCVRFEVPGRVQ